MAQPSLQSYSYYFPPPLYSLDLITCSCTCRRELGCPNLSTCLFPYLPCAHGALQTTTVHGTPHAMIMHRPPKSYIYLTRMEHRIMPRAAALAFLISGSPGPARGCRSASKDGPGPSVEAVHDPVCATSRATQQDRAGARHATQPFTAFASSQEHAQVDIPVGEGAAPGLDPQEPGAVLTCAHGTAPSPLSA